MADATFNDVIKSQRASANVQFDEARGTNVLLRQLIKKFEPFKKSLANKFDEQFSNEYEKEGEKIVRTSQSIKDGMSDNFKELFGTMGGSQMKDAFNKVTAGFGILKGTLLGIGLVGGKAFSGLEKGMSFFGKAAAKVSEKGGRYSVGTKVGGFVKNKASNLKSFMDKDLGYGLTGRLKNKDGSKRTFAKNDPRISKKAVRGRQGARAGQLGLKGLTKLTKLITVPLKGISKFIKFLVNVGKTRFLLMVAVIGGIAFGIWKLKDAILQSMDYLGMQFANMGDKFLMAFSGEDKDKVLQAKINSRTFEYKNKYDPKFKESMENFKESGNIDDIANVIDLSNKSMVETLTSKLALEETQIKQLNKDIVKNTANVVASVPEIQELKPETTKKIKDTALQTTVNNYYSQDALDAIAKKNNIAGGGDYVAKSVGMQNDDDGQGYYLESGRIIIPTIGASGLGAPTEISQTVDERMQLGIDRMVQKNVNSQYENLRTGDGEEVKSKGFLEQLDELEKVLMGKTNYDAIGWYSNEQTIDDSNMNANDDMLVKKALAAPALLKTLNAAEISGNFDDLKLLINEIRNSNLELGQAGSNQQLNQITNNSVVNNTQISTDEGGATNSDNANGNG